QGVQTMHIAAGAFKRASDEATFLEFTGSFRWDAVLLQVTSTSPAIGGVFKLPGPFTYDVNFNEPVNPASAPTSDLVVGGIAGASVTGVTLLSGNTTAEFTISGVTTEGQLTASIAAGAITDAFGNPGTAFLSTYTVDLDTIPYPTPLAQAPVGSL